MREFKYPFEPEFEPPPLQPYCNCEFPVQHQPSDCPECEDGMMQYKRTVRKHKKYVCLHCGAVELKRDYGT